VNFYPIAAGRAQDYEGIRLEKPKDHNAAHRHGSRTRT
jgi:hypothetical protein